MGIYKLVLPKMGESVSEATLTKWLKVPGDTIKEDEAVVEIATDKVDSDVPSPVQGILREVLFQEDQVVQVGDVIALIDVEGYASAEPFTQVEPAAVIETVPAAAPAIVAQAAAEPCEEIATAVVDVIPGTDLLERADSASSIHFTNRFYSPLVKNIAQEEGLSADELAAIKGTGAEGRVTKEDILQYLQERSKPTQAATAPAVTAAVNTPTSSPVKANPTTAAVTATTLANGDELIPMDRMRRLIADHMINSVKTSPHVSSFVEADVTNLVNWRNKVKDAYKKREGENLTYTPIFIEAISKMLKAYPMVNVSVDGYTIIKKKHINIGMAAALPSGNLIVPVIKRADELSLVGLSKAVNDLATRSRANQLKPDDTQGGTFTFTNIGAFGNIMGIPIINQPQAAILAVGSITKRPAVLETEHGDVLAIRHMMYLSMSYDHRVIDGALGGTFLKKVADYLENWDINRVI